VPDGADVGGHKVLVQCTFSDGVDSSSFEGSASFTVEAGVDVTGTTTVTPGQPDSAGGDQSGGRGGGGRAAGPGGSIPEPGGSPSGPVAADPPWTALLVVVIGILVIVAVQVAARRRAARSPEASGLRLVAVRGPRPAAVLTDRKR
jgi:hypothetical protein